MPSFGEWFANARAAKNFPSQRDFAKVAKVGRSTITDIESGGGFMQRQWKVKARIAEALGRDVFEVEAKERELDGIRNAQPEPPAGISPTPALPVPTWEVNILASAWIHVPLCAMDTNDPKQAALVKLGRFRLKIIGDCMEPKYRSGDTVEFRRLVYGEDTLIPGKAYVFCRNDDTATFKILHSMPDEGTLILRALNRKEYPDPLPPVLRDEIVSVAIAEGKFVTDDAIDPGQIDAEAMAQLAAAAKQYGLSLSDVIRKAIPRGPMKSKTPKRKAHAR
jgi:transcriptional regulator with XRE-family HTH domain